MNTETPLRFDVAETGSGFWVRGWVSGWRLWEGPVKHRAQAHRMKCRYEKLWDVTHTGRTKKAKSPEIAREQKNERRRKHPHEPKENAKMKNRYNDILCRASEPIHKQKRKFEYPLQRFVIKFLAAEHRVIGRQ